MINPVANMFNAFLKIVEHLPVAITNFMLLSFILFVLALLYRLFVR